MNDSIFAGNESLLLQKEDSDPQLYILMRSDLDSLNPGKAMAQAAHAANAFNYQWRRDGSDAAVEWMNQTNQGFGTTIVLDVKTEFQMSRIVEQFNDLGYCTSVVHDPTYPVQDGYVTHLVPVNTCAFVFFPNGNDVNKSILIPFDLYD